MIKLDETYRQLLAGSAAAGMFVTAYFAQQFNLWVALGAAIGVFVAILLVIERRPPATERQLADGVSEAELSAALTAITEAVRRLRLLEDRAAPSDLGIFAQMADVLERIGAHHREDPRDLRHTRRFLRHDLPRMVETSEAYVELATRAGPGSEERLQRLGARLRSFTPALEKIDRACLENDFMALEVETEVLSEQLEQR